MPHVTCTEDDSGHEIHVHEGDLVSVTLRENPTTGHMWLNISAASGVLVQQEAQFSPGDAAAVGAAGTRRFSLLANGLGRAVLELHLRRPWQADDPPSAHFSLVVHVN